jgi:predicted Zn-dependent peptidase
MKLSHKIILYFFLCLTSTSFSQTYKTQSFTENGYTYSKVTNDPMNTRIYKLANGLTVYLSVYKNAPRIQTFIAVRAGSKNDPANTTGLAHYLEHMVFKGTSKIGTFDWEKEKVLLDKIEALYEQYRNTKDSTIRKKIYAKIDSISGVASKYAIANEYDKMLSSIGAQGTNAYTWVEQTVYVNDIPSNEIERWAKIESERFGELTPRLFHTELEAVYEEKNRGLDNDMSKVIEATFNAMFPNHQYGSQTTIGTVEHLKNPSITEIKKYFYTYYVPNNMAICLSGDFDPSTTIKLIDKYWGTKKPKDVPVYTPFQEKPIEKPVVKTVIGPSPQSLTLCYRFPGAAEKDAIIMEMFSRILSNGKAGLMDLNLVQKQKVLSVSAYPYRMKDYSLHLIFANPREGQSLDEVKKLVLEQIDSIKAGKFDEGLLKAIINNEKIAMMKGLESNNSRADYMVDAFVKGQEWSDYIADLDVMANITKEQIVTFANKYFQNNYSIVYKEVGQDTSIKKVPKPKITPVTVNREKQSVFFKDVMGNNPQKIEPVFMDFNKDFSRDKFTNGDELIYVKNTENQLFTQHYKFNFGKGSDKKMALAAMYLNYLGTDKISAEQFKTELYKLGCEFYVGSTEDEFKFSISGLEENREAAMKLVENLIKNLKPDENALANMVGDILKERNNSKLNKGIILRGALLNYVQYGKESPFTNIIPEKELKSIKGTELVSLIKSIFNYKQSVWYYGPSSLEQIKKSVSAIHEMSKAPIATPVKKVYKELDFTEEEVLFVNYDMVQAEMVFLSKSSSYDKNLVPVASLYNEYFGGSMNSVVFQEIRESKALAYASNSSYRVTRDKDYSNFNVSYIGTQADKLPEAMKAMKALLDSMPKSEVLFNTAKEAVINTIRTERITKMAIPYSWEAYQKLGVDFDLRKEIFEKLQNLKFEDIQSFQKSKVKGQKIKVLVIGSKDKLDFKALEKYGKIKELSLTEIFGY